MTESSDAHKKPHVHIVATGGTIANVGGEYDSPENFLTADDLIEELPKLEEVANITSTGISRLGSSHLIPDVWYDVYEEIMLHAESDDPPDGFVITHGSNTSEETAYFLNLALDTDLPVVVTAAQRGIGKVGHDGFKNLFDAVRTAASPESVGRGALLVANDEIHHSRDVSKLASNRPDAWESSNFGKVGIASPNQPIRFYRSTARKSGTDTVFSLSETPLEEFPLTDIHIVYSALGEDNTVVDAIADDAAGIVVAGFMTGGAASRPEGPSQSEALERAAEKEIPIVMCTRGSYGCIEPKGQDLPGGYGIGGDTLRPQKARILLALGLTKTSDPEELKDFFETY